MAIEHYENFPVASILLPKHLRKAVEVIYAFARSADDLADEGDILPEARLEALNAYETALSCIESRQNGMDISTNSGLHSSLHPNLHSGLFKALADVIDEYQLPIQPFRDLLSAFKQDVVTKRYASFDALLDYCRRSANPVGILMLHLYGMVNEQNVRYSNAICSALQLINFWQDIALDWQKMRVYLPQEDLIRFRVTESSIQNGDSGDMAWKALMHFELVRTHDMLMSGAPLASLLPGRIGWELRMVIQGGARILEKIETVDYDVFRRRPRLTKIDWLRMVWRAIR